MKILAIRLKNLASLAGPIAIDFTAEPLASAGLFAITGPTGAGKSTLLDALCLALFGAVPRLGNAPQSAKVPDGDSEIGSYDPRTLLRRGTGAGFAEVDFVGTDGRRYRARWEANRARDKANGKLQGSRQSLRDLDSDQLLTSQKNEYKQLIEARLGLNFEQFTRAVLLAQSEFSAFLKADDNDRSELLEKLTDTALYTRLGKRAFDKSKQARQALEQLQGQASGIAPLPAEQRQALDQQLLAASAVLKAEQAQLRQTEQQQQWHRENHQLEQALGEARERLQTTQEHWQALTPSQRDLNDLDALAPQRHMFLRETELQQQLLPLGERIQQGTLSQAQLQSHHDQLASERLRAADGIAQALHSQAQAAPALRQAFDEHSHLARLGEQLSGLEQHRDNAREGCLQSRQALQQLLALQQASAERLVQLDQQLQRSEEYRALAEAWQAYRPRLQQAVASSNRLTQGKAELPALQARAGQAADDWQNAQQQLEALYRQADCPADALHERLQQLTGELQQQRLHQRSLEGLQQQWLRASELQQRLAGLAEQHTRMSEQREQRTAEGLRLKVEYQQAEHALQLTVELLKRQRMARSASVEQLRAELEDQHPCPVCGSHDHPWHQPEALLNALGTHDEQEETGARTTVQQLSERLAELRIMVAGLIEQQKSLKQQEAQLLEEQQAIDLAQHPLHAALLEQAPEQRAAWLQAQLRQAGELATRQDQQQVQLLELQRDAALLTRSLQETHAARQQAEQQLGEQQRQLDSDQQRLDEELQNLGQLLAPETVQALRTSATATFMNLERAVGDRLAQVELQREEQHESSERQQRIDLQQVQLHGQEQQQLAAEQNVAALVGQRETVTRRLSELLAGQPDPLGWQQQLQQQVDAAREQEAQLGQQLQQASQELTQVQSRLAADQQQQQALGASLGSLQTSLAQWRAGQPQLDDARLQRLLGFEESSALHLRQQLTQAEKAVEQAQVLLQERQQRHADHQAHANGIPAMEALNEQSQTLLEQLQASEQACADLRAQQADDQRRQAANQQLQLQVTAAQGQYQRWARLSALIGSAEGERFRKIAQAYNLDLLVHHANVQLRQLVRRYRLKRGGSMLGLLVLDTEMGDELRSVHSLSGGETFLVSLALALGLASMASSTLRIESLFIDEGFGSLDPESLQLAMDALDGLQAQGRKVAVISHVQEMHERIPVQIQVRRQGNGLSSVEISGG
jgi:exonuclease SbcC